MEVLALFSLLSVKICLEKVNPLLESRNSFTFESEAKANTLSSCATDIVRLSN
jgi:hypothetical protein